MPYVLWHSLFGAGLAVPEDRADLELTVVVPDDLETIAIDVRASVRAAAPLSPVTAVLAADRHASPPDPLYPGNERDEYPTHHALGGFASVSMSVGGVPCPTTAAALSRGERLLTCDRAIEGSADVAFSARLAVPARFGPIGRIGRQVTLGGGWYPYLARPGGPPFRGRVRARVTIPASMGLAIGGRVYPPVPSDGPRTIEYVEEDVRQLPMVVLPPFFTTRPIGSDGRILFIRRPPLRGSEERRCREVEDALADGLRFLSELGRMPEPPLLVVEAPLRHELSQATDGLVLLSDRAFRLFPVDRFFRFHRFPVLREVFTAILLRSMDHVAADATGAWLLDRYTESRVGRAENAFDVLSFWSFIPAVDSLLYAPELPFVGAYFRLIEEDDPLHANLVDFPDPSPRGKVVYEKLLDRLGREETGALFEEVLGGRPLEAAVADRLGAEAAPFLSTWLGPYPDVRYRLAGFTSEPCGAGYCTEVRIERDGEPIAEPIQVLLEDGEGEEHVVVAPASADAVRTVTATTAHEVDYVELDPYGRLAEAPSEDTPSPQLDNASSASWRFVLNNFSLLVAATAAQLDTSIDVGFSRVRDVHWRFGANGGVSPASVSLAGRVTRYFGPTVTPDSLSHWVGAAIGGDYLRPEFTDSAEPGFSFSGALYYGYDDRRTVWAPEAGTAFRLVVDYSHVFGESGDPLATTDAVAVTARFLQSFRIAAAHQVSLRASAGAYLYGRPREQLLYTLGGRRNVRGYDIGEAQARMRGIASAEWVHPLLGNANADFLEVVWMTGIDGAFFVDAAVIGDDFRDATDGPVFGDVGYGLRFYIDYFGVRPGVVAIDLAFPLVDANGAFGLHAPALYIDFTQSFLAF